ncbi:hypothetical protein IKF92_03005 [Candidatus Saccharibacteria bacterium]|nr:hypothetical protein [Candidatus Saccharibacteria bacterium]
MAKKSNNNNLILGICAAVAVVVVIVVIAVVVIGKGNTLNDDYFKSDDTKLVLSMETGTGTGDETSEPVKAHEVYEYKDESITSLKTYYEYANEDAAKAAYDKAKEDELPEGYESMELNGKYIVLTAKADQYENLKASDVKENIEFMEQLKNHNVEDTDDGNGGESEDGSEKVDEE